MGFGMKSFGSVISEIPPEASQDALLEILKFKIFFFIRKFKMADFLLDRFFETNY